MRVCAVVLAALIAAFVPLPAVRAAAPLTLVVDARDVGENILHVTLDVPIAGGPATLVFPKWVPGEHSPANPLADNALLVASVDGKTVAWTRDPYDLYAFTFAAPPAATTLHLQYDVLLEPGNATDRLALVNWNPTLLYPAGTVVANTMVAAALIVPPGWETATALDGPKRTGDRIDFAPVSVERLFDSPVLASANLARLPLGPTAELDVASDSPVAPVVDPAVLAHFKTLVVQAQSLFGSHHWRAPYHFLITASDAISYTGLEHHQSSWNGVDTDTLASDAACKKWAGDLLTHEFTHSWNGKYRRPAGLVRADYQADETTDLLWVYEGLTEYYSDILAVRSGFWTPAEYRAALAAKYAELDAKAGRITRSLADTTFDERLRLTAGPHATFASARRVTEDYYDEGELIWLDADTLIRERTHGARSLDDFARAFYGVGGDTGPAVLPYTRADLVAALNAVLPYDWEAFFHARIDVPTAHPPLDGITRGGYAFAFAAKTDTPNPATRAGGSPTDYRYDLGASIGGTGVVSDVIPGSPAAHAGLAPGMSIVALDGRRFSGTALNATIVRDATSKAPMTLLVTNHQAFSTLTLMYDGGIRIPVLNRATGLDLIEAILSPRI